MPPNPYQSPEERTRKPWGLFNRDARATPWGVARHGMLAGIVGAAFYGVVIALRNQPTEAWALKLVAWSAACAAIGALAEWQGDSGC